MRSLIKLSLVLFALLACDKTTSVPEEVATEIIESWGVPQKTDPSAKIGTPVRFALHNFNSSIPNFKDTAEKALEVLSQVFSSAEFRDSISKYDFPCSNGRKNPCSGIPQVAANKCSEPNNRVLGTTVYADLVADSVRPISLHVRTSSNENTTVYGSATPCSYNIYTNDWWLNNNRPLPLSQSYAVHLAHEYAHVVGYVHNDPMHTRREDVAYRVGNVVNNILHRWTGKYDIPDEPLHTLLGQTGYKYMRIRVPELADLSSDFLNAYNASLNQYTAIGQNISYLYLYFDPEVYPSTGKVRLYLRGMNSSNQYFLIWFEYTMRVNDDGIATFEYTNNHSAVPANVTRTQPIRDYLTSRVFETGFTSASAPANSILGLFTSLTNSNSSFYGIMLDAL